MAKSELGTKRLCPNCGAKYYDMFRDPVICPKCGALFATGVVSTRAIAANEPDEEEELEEEVDLVALEDVAEDDTADADVVDGDDLTEVEAEDIAGEDDTFIADDDEDADPVVDVVPGDVDEDDQDR